MTKEKPCWEELISNNGSKREIKLLPMDFGTITELIGIRTIREILKSKESLSRFYPDIDILRRKKINGDWDYGAEIHYKNNGKFGKNILLFEIKYGKYIPHKQMHKYSDMIINPKDYFPEVNEIKVFYMMFDKVDTVNRIASYHFCELERSLAERNILINSTHFSPFHSLTIHGL
jgi:hypothetical protein